MKASPFPTSAPTASAIVRAVGTLSLTLACGATMAQAFPTRPIIFVSPFPPGGGNDLITRTLAAPMTKSLGHPVVVENRPGAETSVAMISVARAAPDGYTVILASSTFAINAALNANPSYGIKDFEPVSLIGSTPFVISVPVSSPAKTLSDLVAMAKVKPGTVFAGATSLSSRLGIELLNLMTDIKMVHVPYKGSGPAITDLVAGRVSTTLSTYPSVSAQIKAGKLRPLALTGKERSGSMPDVPSVAEALKLPGYDASTWYGMLAPAKTPADVVRKLSAEVVKAVKDPTVKDVLGKQDIDLSGSTPEQFRAYVTSEIDKWAKVIKFAGVTAEE